MPSDFDWIFKRDPFWRERPKEEAPAVRHRPLVGGTQTAETAGSNSARTSRESSRSR